jgi:GAF domain-containing protein
MDAPLHPQELVTAVRAAGLALEAERASLYVRRPDAHAGCVLARWRAREDIPDVPRPLMEDWQPEEPELPARDPLFARALEGRPLDAVDDVEHVPPGLADPEHERQFGHRAVLHVNLNGDGELHGVLEVAMTSGPREWSAEDLTCALYWRERMTPLARAAAASRPPRR